jgi:hypothetical protein
MLKTPAPVFLAFANTAAPSPLVPAQKLATLTVGSELSWIDSIAAWFIDSVQRVIQYHYLDFVIKVLVLHSMIFL